MVSELGRILAIAVFGVLLIANVLTEEGKREAPESWTRPCGWSSIAASQTIVQAIRVNSADWKHHE